MAFAVGDILSFNAFVVRVWAADGTYKGVFSKGRIHYDPSPSFPEPAEYDVYLGQGQLAMDRSGVGYLVTDSITVDMADEDAHPLPTPLTAGPGVGLTFRELGKTAIDRNWGSANDATYYPNPWCVRYDPQRDALWIGTPGNLGEAPFQGHFLLLDRSGVVKRTIMLPTPDGDRYVSRMALHDNVIYWVEGWVSSPGTAVRRLNLLTEEDTVLVDFAAVYGANVEGIDALAVDPVSGDLWAWVYGSDDIGLPLAGAGLLRYTAAGVEVSATSLYISYDPEEYGLDWRINARGSNSVALAVSPDGQWLYLSCDAEDVTGAPDHYDGDALYRINTTTLEGRFEQWYGVSDEHIAGEMFDMAVVMPPAPVLTGEAGEQGVHFNPVR